MEGPGKRDEQIIESLCTAIKNMSENEREFLLQTAEKMVREKEKNANCPSGNDQADPDGDYPEEAQ